MPRFFRDHCTDLSTEEFDPKTGYGAVRLPDPAEIAIAEYTDAPVPPAGLGVPAPFIFLSRILNINTLRNIQVIYKNQTTKKEESQWLR